MTNQNGLGRTVTDINRELIEQCRKGDRVAQYRLYKLYSQAMYNICLRMVPDTQDAQDLVQESFISAFSKLKSFRGDCTFGVWLRRIVINQCISFLRKKKILFVDIHENNLPDMPDEEIGEPDLSPGLIHRSLLELPVKARVIFTLFCLEGYRHQEIAGMLSITESTSKTQYHRAKIMLQQKVKEKLHEEQARIIH
jgi:RNA polymerase sigma-70 factor (ECF subfamily)